MSESRPRNVPLPEVQALVVCREIFRAVRSGAIILVEPTGHIKLPRYPACARLSVYVHMTGCHGVYDFRVQLRDADDEAVWAWAAPDPYEHREPLRPGQVVFNDFLVDVPRAGRYTMALVANGEDLARHAVWFVTPENP